MKRFLNKVFLFFLIPIALLLGVYLVTDPYKTLKPFSLTYFDTTNRDYLSSELFLLNNPSEKYNSFIFGSSRGCGINTYQWKSHLPVGAKQFLFQSWGETITGIEQKIKYLDEHGARLDYAIVLIDIPGTFARQQIPTSAISLRHPTFSHQSKFVHEVILFYDFIQKPSQWIKAISGFISKEQQPVTFDPISNDWDGTNRNRDLTKAPLKDSLKNCSRKTRIVFLKEIEDLTAEDIKESDALISDEFKKQLHHIKTIFDKQNTDYRIIITPAFAFTHPQINRRDLMSLGEIFGDNRVFDYSGLNEWTSDYNNFSDPNHFGLFIGWHVIEEIYKSEPEK